MSNVIALRRSPDLELLPLEDQLAFLLQKLDEVPEDERDASYYERRAYAKNTNITYAAGIRSFVAWSGLAFPFPTTARLICQYLVAQRHLSASTMRVYVSAIGWAHRLLDFHDPTNEAIDPSAFRIGNVIRGLHREQVEEHGRRVEQAPTLTAEYVVAMANAAPANLMGVRDKAFLLVAAFGAFRQSEISKLTWEDIRPIEGGYAVRMGTTKQDPLNEKRDYKGLPRQADTRICPVQALDRWQVLSKNKAGPVFRGVTQYGTVLRTAITHPTANRIIKQLARRAGIPDPDRYSGHSLRATFISLLLQAGMPPNQVVLQTKQKESTLGIYNRPELALKNNPAFQFGEILQRC